MILPSSPLGSSEDPSLSVVVGTAYSVSVNSLRCHDYNLGFLFVTLGLTAVDFLYIHLGG